MQTTRLFAREGEAFSAVLTLRSEDGTPLDITGWTFALDLFRQAGTPDVELAMAATSGAQGFEVIDGESGELGLVIDQATIEGIPDTTGDFTVFGDLFGTAPSADARFLADIRLNITTAGSPFGGQTYSIVLDAVATSILADVNTAGATQVAAVETAGAEQLAQVEIANDEALANASAILDSTTLYRQSTPVSGGTSGGASTRIIPVQITEAGTYDITLGTAVTAAVTIYKGTKSGVAGVISAADVFTSTGNVALASDVAGVRTAQITLAVGDWVWVYGALTRTTVSGGQGFWSVTAAGNVPSPTANAFQSGFEFEFQLKRTFAYVTTTRVKGMETSLTKLDTISRVTKGYLGMQATPVAGPSTMATATHALVRPLPADITIDQVEFELGSGGTIKINEQTRSGTNNTVTKELSLTGSAGFNRKSVANGDFTAFTMSAGRLLGYTTGAVLKTFGGITAENDGIYSISAAKTVGDTFAAATISYAASPRIRVRYYYTELPEVSYEAELAAVSIPTATGKLRPDLSADMVGRISYGQSNDQSRGTTVISSASTKHYSHSAGPKATDPALSVTGLATNPGTGAIGFLAEDLASGDNHAPGGETSCSGFVEGFDLEAPKRGLTAPVWFASVTGLGGTYLAALSSFSFWYANLKYSIQTAFNGADKLGMRFALAAIPMSHGEADQSQGTSRADYRRILSRLIDKVALDTIKITRQKSRPIWLLTTAPSGITVSSGAADAILDLCRDRPDCIYIGPQYNWPFKVGDGAHLTSAGQKLRGRYDARALAQAAAGIEPHRIWWQEATYSGATVTIYARSPTALQWGGATATDRGFKIIDGTGTLTLSSITMGTSVVQPDGWYRTPITMTVNRALGTSPQIHYAKHYLGSGLGIDSGASGEVFDSTTDQVTIDGTAYTMNHAAPPTTRDLVAA